VGAPDLDPGSRQYRRAVLGAPLVPPGRVTRALTRFRSAWLGVHRATAPPAIRILEGLFGLFDNRVLGLLVELEIPERLDRPATAEDLAATTGTDPDALDRVLRYAAGRGYLDCDRRGRYRSNAVLDSLRRDNVNSWRPWVEFAASDWFWDSWRHLDAAVRPGGTSGTEAATGHPFFEYVNTVRPDAGRAFNAAMEAGGTLQAIALGAALDWRRIGHVCDVGGGSGATLEYLLATNDGLRATLFDLPEVVAEARPALRSGALAARAQIVGGSFFDAVPGGADRYLLLAIVHDWSDDEAVSILTRVAEAMGPDAETVVVENVLPDAPRDEFVAASDLLMLVVASGRERTLAGFNRVFSASGLRLERRVLLATGASAFLLRRT
jgi:hypothetical protein